MSAVLALLGFHTGGFIPVVSYQCASHSWTQLGSGVPRK